MVVALNDKEVPVQAVAVGAIIVAVGTCAFAQTETKIIKINL